MSETILMQQDRLNKVESILVSQARPSDEKSPYFELARKYNLKVDFRPFIEIQGRGKARKARRTAVFLCNRANSQLSPEIYSDAEKEGFCRSKNSSRFARPY